MGAFFKHIKTGAIKSVDEKHEAYDIFDKSMSWVKVDKSGNPIERGAPTSPPPPRPMGVKEVEEKPATIKKFKPS